MAGEDLRLADEVIEELRAEIERLRGVIAARDAEIKALRDTIPPLIEDNERLRIEVANRAHFESELQKERERVRALRAAVMESCHWSWTETG